MDGEVGMITLGKVSIAEVMKIVDLGAPRAWMEHGDDKHIVKVCASQRIMVFAKSMACVCCERIGVGFRLERHTPHQSPHLNLYAADNVLMTKDHIVPKSKGGRNHMSNYQTMCAECNDRKGST